MKPARTSAALALPLVAACLVSSAASADGDRATMAEALFEQGRVLMDAGRHDEACSKFLESERLDHGAGTLLNLADCYERSGKTASAWAQFRAAAAAASAENQPEREQIALQRERALRAVVPKLTILVGPQHRASGLEIRRDGILIVPALWGVPLPVDPGLHQVRAEAPGRRPWMVAVDVPRKHGASITTVVPALEGLQAGEEDAKPTVERTGAGHFGAQRIAGVSLIAGGAVGIAIASVLGARAIALNDDSAGHCVGRRCDSAGVGLRDEARTHGTASTVTFVAAGALVTGGAALYLLAASAKTQVGVGLVGGDRGGFVVGGTF